VLVEPVTHFSSAMSWRHHRCKRFLIFVYLRLSVTSHLILLLATPKKAPTWTAYHFLPGEVSVTSIGSYQLILPLLTSSSLGALSTAAKAREKQLRDDPMAIVLSPLYVDCKGCGKRIKLSTKSLYDLSHWRTHRARCLKRQPSLLKKPSSNPDVRKRCAVIYSIYTRR
jgi:hypothetical protein